MAVLTGGGGLGRAATSIFVGLIVPHALRPFVGVQHRRLIPAAALGGGTFVLACDIAGPGRPHPREIPLGVVTGLIGAPVFLWLLAPQPPGAGAWLRPALAVDAV